MNTSRARQCQGKVRHRTERGARLACRISGEVNGDLTMEAYRCRHCRGWHVGHPSKSRQRKLRVERLLQLIERANAKGTR